MFEIGLTPVQQENGVYLKREDLACFECEAQPSGAKVRQYARMITAAPADAVLAVGCSAASAMQIYVAAMGKQWQRDAYIAVPKRKQRHACTQWCADNGAHIIETVPGYPSVFRARIRQHLQALDLRAVRWDVELAARDTAAQVANLPDGVRRIVVPNGSGLTAAGIVGGLWQQKRLRKVEVHIVSTHDTVGTRRQVLRLVDRYFGTFAAGYAKVTWRAQTMPYHTLVHGALKDGTRLDPFYAAKAMRYCGDGDCLWLTGRRPFASYQAAI